MTGALLSVSRMPLSQPFGEGVNDLKAEANRYAIYWAHGCHWSNRPVIVRDILGLTDVIGDVATSHSGQSNIYGHGFADQKVSGIRSAEHILK